MRNSLIAGFVIVIAIILFLLWGLYYHQIDCTNKCERAEERLEKDVNTGELKEMTKSCRQACEYFMFDGKQIWFFNWRIK